MKWWTDCFDQLFPGFKTPRLWVPEQCRSSTPPPTSHRGRHIAASFLDSRWGGNKCSLRGGKSADQNRPPIYRPLSKTAGRATKRTADWQLVALSKNSFWVRRCQFLGLNMADCCSLQQRQLSDKDCLWGERGVTLSHCCGTENVFKILTNQTKWDVFSPEDHLMTTSLSSIF